MKCPVDEETLVMTDRNGVEIDYCPKCRGVWLDRGELDKIIERTAGPASSSARPPNRPSSGSYDDRRQEHYKKKKKHSLLGELFDF